MTFDQETSFKQRVLREQWTGRPTRSPARVVTEWSPGRHRGRPCYGTAHTHGQSELAGTPGGNPRDPLKFSDQECKEVNILRAIYDKLTFPRGLLKSWLRDTYFLHLHLKTNPSGERAQHSSGTRPCCSAHASTGTQGQGHLSNLGGWRTDPCCPGSPHLLVLESPHHYCSLFSVATKGNEVAHNNFSGGTEIFENRRKSWNLLPRKPHKCTYTWNVSVLDG